MKRLCARFVQEEILILEGAYHIKEQVRIGEIRYLWSQKNYLLYMLISNRQVRIRKTMEKAQEELRGKGFLRIHKSLLVNMGHLVQIDYKRNCVEMTGGEWLESRSAVSIWIIFAAERCPEKVSLKDGNGRYVSEKTIICNIGSAGGRDGNTAGFFRYLGNRDCFSAGL